MYAFDELMRIVRRYNPSEIELVKKAFNFAMNAHEGQERRNGDPFIVHPVAAATFLADEIEVDGASLAAALLHDTVEDNNKITIGMIHREFNEDIAHLVSGVSKLTGLDFTETQEKFCANTRRLILSMNKDIRIILIKLADRLHNMRTLMYMPPEKQIGIAKETMDIYVPIAYRLGAYKIMRELQDCAFYYLYPEEKEEFPKLFNSIKEEAAACLETMSLNIIENLWKKQIYCDIETDYKNDYEIYMKKWHGYEIADIHDLIKLKIIADSMEECNIVLGIIRELYRSTRDKNYMGPKRKENLYQAYHTTLFEQNYQRSVQAQIFTAQMQKMNDYGVFSFYSLREQAKSKMQETIASFPFIKELNMISKMGLDNKYYIDIVKDELFCITVRVYSAAGEMIEIAENSTVMDYAFKINEAFNMVDVIVNGRREGFNYILKNDDIIRIISNNQENVGEHWKSDANRNLTKKLIDERLNNNSHNL